MPWDFSVLNCILAVCILATHPYPTRSGQIRLIDPTYSTSEPIDLSSACSKAKDVPPPDLSMRTWWKLPSVVAGIRSIASPPPIVSRWTDQHFANYPMISWATSRDVFTNTNLALPISFVSPFVSGVFVLFAFLIVLSSRPLTTSVFSESFGVSVKHQPDIDLWSSSTASGFNPPGEEIFPAPSEELLSSDMAHFSDLFAKSESGSSMDDSAYVSQTDGGRSSNQQESLLNQSFDQFLCSPAMSSDSHGGFQGPQSNLNQFSISDSATDTNTGFDAFQTADAGGYGGLNSFSNTSTLDISGTSLHRGFDSDNWQSHAFNNPFAVSSLSSNAFYNPQTINPQFADAFSFDPSEKTQSGPQGDGQATSLKRAQAPRMQLDTASVMNPTSLTSPSPLSANVRGNLHRPTTGRSSSGIDLSSASSHTMNDVRYESSSYYKSSSLKSPSTKSSDLKVEDDEDLDDESRVLPQTSSGRIVEDAESKLARTHPLYQATPGKDDMYHCPEEGKPGCNHKPTKLKCNYDKYVDSHLRPYKCKITSCDGTQFSSTACLLRHEREAHGMHGHGSKPNLCSFPDCERSIPGNGFPRRYNLYDHMKRVHDYTPSATSPDEMSPTMPTSATTKRPGNRKRKSTATSEEITEKRQKSIAIKAQPNVADITPKKDLRQEELARLRNEWSAQRANAQQHLIKLATPMDMQSYPPLREAIQAMEDIAHKITELGG